MVKNRPTRPVKKPTVDPMQAVMGALGHDEILTVDVLFERAGVKPTKAAFRKLAQEAAAFITTTGGSGDAFRGAHVTSKANAARAAASDEVLLGLLHRLASTGHKRAHTVSELSKAAGPYESAVKDALIERTDRRSWPMGVGAVRRDKKTTLIFLMAHVAGSPVARQVQPTLAGEPAANFAEDFERAFDELRRDRMFNRVELHALRDALPQYPRTVFDRELAALRKAERFQLRTADGRHHRLTDQERAAMIEERGEQYYYVARWTRD